MFDPFGLRHDHDVADKPENPFPNGPRPVKYLTAGQVRRRRQREAESRQRKIDRQRRRNYFAQQDHEATVRGWVMAFARPDLHTTEHLNQLAEAAMRRAPHGADEDWLVSYLETALAQWADDIAVAA